jgi:4-amino-4-deoxy-L-arabinose transferase-like glycosyltransferase
MIKSVAGLQAYGIVALFLLVALPRSAWWRRELLWGLLLSVLIAAPWHIGQLLIWGRHFWDSYMVSLTIGYVTGDQGHTRDLLYYFRILQWGFPVLHPVLALTVTYGLYRGLRYRLGASEKREQNQATILLLCWVAVPMVLYNLSRSRIGWYIIPTYPALALLAADLLVSALRGRLAVVLLLVVTLALNPWLPRAGDFNPDVKKVASYSHHVLGDQSIVVNYWPGSYWIRPSALFYADRPLLLVTDEQAMQQLLLTPGDFWVLADWSDWEPLAHLADVVYRSGDYMLAHAHRPDSSCPSKAAEE